MDTLLARDEADASLAELGREPPVRLLREHPERRRIDAPPRFDEKAERVVRLARVRRSEVRDHRLRLDTPVRQPDRQLGDGTARRLSSPMPFAPTGALLPPPRH
jgi:hypothetical protein